MIRTDFDGIAPAPDLFPVCQREASDQVLFFLCVVIVQVNPAAFYGCSRIAFTDGSLPKHFRPSLGPFPKEPFFRGDVVPVRTAKLRPVATGGCDGNEKQQTQQSRNQRTGRHKYTFFECFDAQYSKPCPPALYFPAKTKFKH
jgi:hypothetical protein